MRFFPSSMALVIIAAAFCSAGILPARSVAAAGTLRIALLANAEVRGDTVLLANFLPPRVPASIQVAAQSVSLGASPQTGSFRRFSRNAVAVALQHAGISSDAFLVPEFLTARRSGKFLTQQDAFAAIQAALAKMANGKFASLRPEDLLLDTGIALPDTEPALDVTHMSFDPSIRRTRFRLHSRNAPGTPSFYVSAATPLPLDASTVNTLGSLGNTNSLLPDSPVLVDPRQPARLHLHSPNSDMLLVVRPLQRGRLNETIRVRLAASGRTLQAKVVAANSLDATF